MVGHALALLLAITGAELATAACSDDERVEQSSDPVPHLIPAPQPGAVQALHLLSSSGVPSIVGTTVVWTDQQDDEPEPGARVIDLAVRRGELRPSAPTVTTAIDGRTVVDWTDDSGAHFILQGAGVDAATLEQMQESTTLDPDGVLRTTPPDGFHEVDHADTRRDPVVDPFSNIGRLGDADRTGYAITFDGPADTFSIVTVLAQPRSRIWGAATRITERTTVRGRAAYQMDINGTGPEAYVGTVLIWWEDDDVAVTVEGPTPEAARDIAESLEDVDDATWVAFVRSAPDGVARQATTTTVP
jgi:hypothetical protein